MMTDADYRADQYLEDQIKAGNPPEWYLESQREAEAFDLLSCMSRFSNWLFDDASEQPSENAVDSFVRWYDLEPERFLETATVDILMAIALSSKYKSDLRIAAMDEVRKRYLEEKFNV